MGIHDVTMVEPGSPVGTGELGAAVHLLPTKPKPLRNFSHWKKMRSLALVLRPKVRISNAGKTKRDP